MKKLMRKIFADLNQAVEIENRQLIRQAIASDQFPTFVDRIIENNGTLGFFLGGDIE